MAFEHVATFLCEKVLSDRGGKATPVGLFFDFRVGMLPAQRQFSIVAAFRGTPGTPFNLSIANPAGEEALLDADVIEEAENGQDPDSTPTLVSMDVNTTFEDYGVYRVYLRSGEFEHALSFSVSPLPEAETAEKE